MATYSNEHWLLSHIRNSFISTDDTGMCETVMASDDLPKSYLRKFQSPISQTQFRKIGSNGNNSHTAVGGSNIKPIQRVLDQPLKEIDFVCYPGLDQSDDEDGDLSTQSFDIQMYPEVGAHRLRSNTAQKLEKMDIARRKAARTKCINYDDEVIGPERNDLFVRKIVEASLQQASERSSTAIHVGDVADDHPQRTSVLGKSKLSLQLANSPKQSQNKFMEYARFDGTSQTGIQTKRINVFVNMLPEKERNYPIKICVIASAKITEVIGFICYKTSLQFPNLVLKPIHHYALYMTEDIDDLEDFPPLDNREPCSKFGFSHLTLAERRPLAPVTRIEFHNNKNTKSVTGDEDKFRSVTGAASQNSNLNISHAADVNSSLTSAADSFNYEERILSQNEMLEAPIYRTYRLQIIDKRFFKTDATLGISAERIEIDQHKSAKFWTKQKAVTYTIDAIAFCEIIERRNLKAILRIWIKAASSPSSSSSGVAATVAACSGDAKSSLKAMGVSKCSSGIASHSPPNSGQYQTLSSPFAMFSGGSGTATATAQQQHMRIKHYDFEADLRTAMHILNKLNCILDVRSSEVRREFLQMRERKLEKNQAKKHHKIF